MLVHFVKFSCLYSVNPFSTFFSANNQHNCPILFCMCPTYLPAGLAFRFSFQKQLHLHFWGKWPLAPSIFWTNKLFSQIYSPKWLKLSNGIIPLLYFFWLGLVSLPQVCMICRSVLQTKMKWRQACNWANYHKNYFTIFCKQLSIFLKISSNFLQTIFIPQATIGTKNPLNLAKIGAKTTTS